MWLVVLSYLSTSTLPGFSISILHNSLRTLSKMRRVHARKAMQLVSCWIPPPAPYVTTSLCARPSSSPTSSSLSSPSSSPSWWHSCHWGRHDYDVLTNTILIWPLSHMSLQVTETVQTPIEARSRPTIDFLRGLKSHFRVHLIPLKTHSACHSASPRALILQQVIPVPK